MYSKGKQHGFTFSGSGSFVPACTKTGTPILFGSSVFVGEDYPVPVPSGLDVADGSPPNRTATEWKVDGYSNWGDTTVTFPTVGSPLVNVYGRNCFNATGDFVAMQVHVQNSGWVAGEPRLSLNAGFSSEMGTDPATITFDPLFVFSADVTTVTITDVTGAPTVVYSGPIQVGMTNSTFYTCAVFAANPNRVLEVTATNATGSMTLTGVPMILQDNMGACP